VGYGSKTSNSTTTQHGNHPVTKFALSMLTEEEKRFIDYWEHHRQKKRRVLKQLYFGLPLGVLIVAAILINFFSGWDKRAQAVIKKEPSIILTILIAVLLIVVFITIFSVRHNWEMNEQRYRELLLKKDEQV